MEEECMKVSLARKIRYRGHFHSRRYLAFHLVTFCFSEMYMALIFWYRNVGRPSSHVPNGPITLLAAEQQP